LSERAGASNDAITPRDLYVRECLFSGRPAGRSPGPPPPLSLSLSLSLVPRPPGPSAPPPPGRGSNRISSVAAASRYDLDNSATARHQSTSIRGANERRKLQTVVN
jgi:hypothetical protein